MSLTSRVGLRNQPTHPQCHENGTKNISPGEVCGHPPQCSWVRLKTPEQDEDGLQSFRMAPLDTQMRN